MDTQAPRNDSAGPHGAISSRGIRFAIVVCALAFPVAFWVLINPATARAAWAHVARIMDLGNARTDATAGTLQFSDVSLAGLAPQEQAELLLEAAIQHSASAGEQITKRAPAWRGRLKPTPRLKGLVDVGLNSPALDIRAAAVEVELGVNNLAENKATADALIARIQRDPEARAWGLWMLGALGNRGVETGRILAVLSEYSRDSSEKTRFWALEGLSLLGREQSIPVLLTALRSDTSQSVRERAASALGHSGMLTKEQRFTAVPQLIEDASDRSLDTSTQILAYQALHDITGARIDDTPSAWREYWAGHAAP